MNANLMVRLSRAISRLAAALIDRVAPIPQLQPRSAFAPVELPAFDPARLQGPLFGAGIAQPFKE